MSVPKKLSLTSLGSPAPSKKDKTLAKALRFEINITEPSKDEFCQVSYEELVSNYLKKKRVQEKGVNGSGLDPFASDDEDQLKELAKKYELKYGNEAKSKKRRKHDFVDIGAGYDETDPFIDNTEAYDEFVPPNVSTVHGGFYVNCGNLEFKAVEFSESESESDDTSSESSGIESSSGESDSSEDEESSEKEKVEKNRKRLISTEGSGSSRPATPDAVNLAEKQKEKIEVKRKKVEEVKRVNGVSDKTSKLIRTDVEKSKPPEPPTSKSESDLTTSKTATDSVFDTIESVVKASVLKSGPTENGKIDLIKTPRPSPPEDHSPRAGKISTLKSDILKSKPKLGDIDKSDTSASAKKEVLTPVLKKGTLLKPVSDDSESENETSSSGGEEEEEEESETEESEGEESSPSIKKDVESCTAVLPENLPFELISVINALKEKAEEDPGTKSKFFTEEVNKILVRIELHSMQLRCQVRQNLYYYLTSFLPIKKGTLLKRLRNSLAHHIVERKNVLLGKLKTLVSEVLPDFLQRYGADLEDLEEDEKIVVFKSFISFSENIREQLGKIIFLKSHHFKIIKSRKDSPKEAIMLFLRNEVSLAFLPGFFCAEFLYDVTQQSHYNITSGRKLTAKERKIDHARLSATLIRPTKPPKVLSPIPKLVKKSKAAVSKKSVSSSKLTELSKESKVSNWDVSKKIEMKILAEKEEQVPEKRQTVSLKRARTDSVEISEHKRYAQDKPRITVSTVKIPENSRMKSSPSHRSESPNKAPQNSPQPAVASSIPPDNYRATVVSVENTSETARLPKIRSPKPKAVKQPKERHTEVINMEHKPAPKSTFKLHTEAEKALESILPLMSPTYGYASEVEQVSFQEEDINQCLDAVPEEKLAVKDIENYEPASSSEDETQVSEEQDQLDLSWVFNDLSEISQKAKDSERDFGDNKKLSQNNEEVQNNPSNAGKTTDYNKTSNPKVVVLPPNTNVKHDTGESIYDEKMNDIFGKMFELTESVIRDNKTQKCNNGQHDAKGHNSDKHKMQKEVHETIPSFSSKKHKALQYQKSESSEMYYSDPNQKAYLDFLKNHRSSYIPSELDVKPSINCPTHPSSLSISPRSKDRAINSRVVSDSSKKSGESNGFSVKPSDIPSYSAAQYFNQKDTDFHGGTRKDGRKSDSGSGSSHQRLFHDSLHGKLNQSGDMSHQLSCQPYASERPETALNFSRSSTVTSGLSAYTSVQSYNNSMSYQGEIQRSYPQGQHSSRDQVANDQHKLKMPTPYFDPHNLPSQAGSENYQSSCR
ncbi:yemanuclein-like [Artemia franciscana]|uniref:Ubinuclein-1 n=1 Tax=Artemia franciscana TaxID=6661 RepID=A0AA88HVQ8_ARTSF|nr:hypothetical protein QYM36_009893 [Artemia franciscana]